MIPNNTVHPKIASPVHSTKKILFWYEPYRGPLDLRLAGCPVWQCNVTSYDRNGQPVFPEEYDAIVFHFRDWVASNIPERRSPKQNYVMLTMESPAWRIVNTEEMSGFFNLTMTYRHDSDVVNPYGWFSKKNISLEEDHYVNYATNKTKVAAWFVSNCESLSGRNEFVAALQQFISVDVYGQCGPLKCPRSHEESCRLMVERDYKFYLSLENSLCADYITEKFFTLMRYNIVPIVFDLHGHHSRITPPHSYINAADFPSVRELADYLILLDKNDTLYNEYFSWKKNYDVHDAQGGICRLCAHLHAREKYDDSAFKVYRNMTEWWETRAECQTVHFRTSSGSDSTSTRWQSVPLSRTAGTVGNSLSA